MSGQPKRVEWLIECSEQLLASAAAGGFFGQRWMMWELESWVTGKQLSKEKQED